MAWLYLGRSVRRREEGTGTGRLLRIAALWAAPLIVCVPLFSRDLYAYAAQAQIAHAGLDPYSVGPVSLPGPFLDEISGMWVDTPAPYGPLFLGLGRALATVTGDRVVTTVLAMRLLAVAGVLLTAKYLPRLARAAGGDPRVAVWLGIANPLVLVHFVAGGHNDALMIGLLVAGLTIAIEATEERWVALGVVLCSAAVLVKAPAAVAVAFLAWVWARQLTGRMVLLRACVRTGGGRARHAGRDHRRDRPRLRLDQPAQRLRPGRGLDLDPDRHRHAHRGRAQRAELRHVPGPGDLGVPAGGPGRRPPLVLLWLWLRAGRIGWVRAAGLALLVVVFLGPVVQPWYVLWGLGLLAATRLDRRVVLVAAGGSFWLSMMIAPQGSNLFLEVGPVIATSIAARWRRWRCWAGPRASRRRPRPTRARSRAPGPGHRPGRAPAGRIAGSR